MPNNEKQIRQDLRLRCLEQAIKNSDPPRDAEKVVASAQQYFDFVTEKQNAGS